VLAILKALLNETYSPPEFENITLQNLASNEVDKIKNALLKLLVPYWNNL
jgi:hypothetical protein